MKNLTWAILVAAGRDTQIESSVSTPFLFLNDRPVIAHVLGALEQTPEIAGTVVVIERENASELLGMMKTYRFSKIRKIVGASARRHTSLASALEHVPPEVEYLCVLDASRPLVTSALISETAKTAWRYSTVATAAEEILDPVAVVKRNIYQERIPSSSGHLWTLLSPQVFPIDVFTSACAQKSRKSDDDLEAVLALYPKTAPRLVPAPPACHVGIRIRSVADLATATSFLHDPNRI